MINQFSGPNRFLSNFFVPHNPITLDPIDYLEMGFGTPTAPTAEHLYTVCKTDDEEAITAILNAGTPGEAKRRGRTVPLIPQWQELRTSAMMLCVRSKFSPTTNPELVDALLSTGDQNLVEGNTWNDTFWGVDLNTGHGENHLGRILMRVRDDLR